MEKSKRKKHQKYQWLRAALQLFSFLFFSSAFTASFAGITYIAAQLGDGEKIAWTAFLKTLAGLCGFTIVFGRFFCGFSCAFGSLGDGIHTSYCWICKKCGKEPLKLSEKISEKLSAVKYLVLVLIVILCYLGVYPPIKGSSPWEVFSMLHAGNFRLSGHLPGMLLLFLIFLGMCVQERFFCRFLCPMGAIFSLLPVLPAFSLRRSRGDCLKGCSRCTRKCPSNIALPFDGFYETTEDCFQCQKCIGTCPKQNIHCGLKEIQGNEIVFTLLRTGLLIALYLWIGL